MSRKLVGWFKVYSDILEDPRLMGEDWVLTAFVKLLAMANRGDPRDGTVTLPQTGLSMALGRKQIDAQLRRLEHLSEIGLIECKLRTDLTGTWHELDSNFDRTSVKLALIFIPKYLERQGIRVPEKCPTKTKTKTKTTTPPKAPLQAAPSDPPGSPESKAKEAWPELRRAAAAYGVGWGKTPGRAQVKIIAERIKSDGLNEDQLEAVIHGYITLRGTTADNGFDPLKHLYPKTLYRPSNWPDYLAAAENAPKRKEPKRTVFEGYDRSGHTLPTQDEITEALAKGRELYKH